MKKPSSKIREEILKLQEQLKAAETREAERIGRIALKAGLGEIEIEEDHLQAAFEDITARFRWRDGRSTGKREEQIASAHGTTATAVEAGAAADGAKEV